MDHATTSLYRAAPWVELPAPTVPACADAMLLPHAAEVPVSGSRLYDAAMTSFTLRNGRGEDLEPVMPKSSPGFVYAGIYPNAPGLVKVGESRFFPTRRLQDLSRRTAAPDEIQMLFAMETPFRHAVEAAAHDALRPLSTKGEWFRLGADDLVGLMLGLVAIQHDLQYRTRLWTTPYLLGMCCPAMIRKLCGAGLGCAPDPIAAAPSQLCDRTPETHLLMAG